jgi:hypothetical protein
MATLNTRKKMVSSIINEGLNLKKIALTHSLSNYQSELEAFEKKYRMKSKIFVKKFESGILGDEASWFEWLFIYRAMQKTEEKLKLLKTIKL